MICHPSPRSIESGRISSAALVTWVAIVMVLVLLGLKRCGGTTNSSPGEPSNLPAPPPLTSQLPNPETEQHLAPDRPLASQPFTRTEKAPALAPLEVVVRFADSGEPAPGAKVWIQTEDENQVESMKLGALDPKFLDSLAQLSGSAESLEADNAGRVQWAFPEGIKPPVTIVLGAARDDRKSVSTLEVTPGETITVDLEPPRWVDVEVVLANGAPAQGLELGLSHKHQSGVFARFTTNEEGRARCLLPASESATSGYQVMVLAPFDPTIRENVGDSSGNGPVKLTLPPSGSIIVRLPPSGSVDSNGGPLGVTLQLGIAHAPSHPVNQAPVALQIVREGEAKFPHVELNQFFTVHLLHSAPGRTQRSEGQGPTEESQTAVLQLGALPAIQFVTARAVDSQGQPLIGQPLMGVQSVSEGPTPPGLDFPIRTGPDGRFSIPTDRIFAKFFPVEVQLLQIVAGVPALNAARGRLLIEGPLIGDETDLGDVTVAPPQLLARGRTLDANGQPVQANVILSRRESAGASFPSTASFVVVENVVSDADGRFSLLGPEIRGPVWLHAELIGYDSSAPVLLEGQDRDYELRVIQSGQLVAHFLLDSGITLLDLSFRLNPVPPDPRQTQPIGSAPVGENSVQFFDVPRGVYDLTVTSQAVAHLPDAQPLHRVPGIRVESGAPVDDPRLAAIDLRGLVKKFRIVVTDAAGTPVRDAIWKEEAISDEAGVLNLMGRPPLSGVIQASGYLPKSVSGIDRDMEVRLDKGIEFRGSISPTGWLALFAQIRKQAKKFRDTPGFEVSIEPNIRIWPKVPAESSDTSYLVPIESGFGSRFSIAAAPGDELELEIHLLVQASPLSPITKFKLPGISPERVRAPEDGSSRLPSFQVDVNAVLSHVESTVKGL